MRNVAKCELTPATPPQKSKTWNTSASAPSDPQPPSSPTAQQSDLSVTQQESSLSPPEKIELPTYEEIKTIFESMDKDGDGLISFEELKATR